MPIYPPLDRAPTGNVKLDWALYYASFGWEVVPCASGQKWPAIAGGFHNATSDIAQIREWWSAMPSADVGLRTGTAFDVLDIDIKDLKQLSADIRRLIADKSPDAPIVSTRRGWHVYFAPEGGRTHLGAFNHVDWKAANGLIIAPPSPFKVWHHPSDGRLPSQLPRAPEQLRLFFAERDQLVASIHTTDPLPPSGNGSRSYGRAALAGALDDFFAEAKPRFRNKALNRVAGRLGRLIPGGYLDAFTIEAALTNASRQVWGKEFKENEVKRTINSGLRFGIDHARAVKPIPLRPELRAVLAAIASGHIGFERRQREDGPGGYWQSVDLRDRNRAGVDSAVAQLANLGLAEHPNTKDLPPTSGRVPWRITDAGSDLLRTTPNVADSQNSLEI